ncbi:PLP-dependent aminotransferase family protein [Paraburkholderia bannensis]|uniref:Transcriptional regulator, GntR family n=1 Tax=Paraburkholderia tropica TaxID=92647 RepID=A0AAQ1JWA0_9BURK|nr:MULTISPECIES: PLP-dependent aminotransferase family protein [Paraburkholderia]QNB13212.1 PLP-dependent aminotransferase family protein [Paraburkholderia tropica]RQM46328.1 PLP-dependent aminotransferase family protein [Paraburkholderia bannensis]RQN37765.1 PLP-dependent aminotransferase family protein [Paraburkholderia tropica]SEK05206.1 transcriptional regulator, GntR family [Paraburkholderia tropica]
MIEIELERGRQAATTLVEQIVRAFARAIEAHTLRTGALLPSVRQLAQSHELSTYTVTEAYNRLVSMGLVVARRGSGYRVAQRAEAPRAAAAGWQPPALAATWLLSDVFADHSVPIKAGCGWMPGEWINETGLHHALRATSRVPAVRLGDYGHPYGFAPLRERVAAQLDRQGLPVEVGNVLLTQGATQGLDLIVRTLLRPGDTVLVEDPGYCNLLQILKLAGLTVQGVPRTPAGLDLDALEQQIAAHRPKAIFVNTTLQNPTGASFTMANAFRLLQIAERERMWVVEDDVSRELAPPGAPLLAAMEGLQRVLYVGGFSKTVTPSLRCGYVVAERDVLRELARAKMAVGLTSSQTIERIVDKVLLEGRYARHVEIVNEQLKAAHATFEERIDALGLEPFCRPRAGLFVWVRLPVEAARAGELATAALRDGIWLAPGSYFRPDDAASSWFRFNAPYSLDDALWCFIERASSGNF